jgi:hypothetical protein
MLIAAFNVLALLKKKKAAMPPAAVYAPLVSDSPSPRPRVVLPPTP